MYVKGDQSNPLDPMNSTETPGFEISRFATKYKSDDCRYGLGRPIGMDRGAHSSPRH